MAASLRGPIKAHHDCTRCANRKQTCDRVLPQCTRCSVISGTSCSYIRVASAAPIQVPQPLFKYDVNIWDSGSTCWKLTQKGQELLMDAAFRHQWSLAAETVQTILAERGRSIEQLLEDDIFKWFPIARSGRLESYDLVFSSDKPDVGMPLLHLAILLITTPPPMNAKGRLPFLPGRTSVLYRTLKAMHAIMSSGIASSACLAQTLGIIALYEFGQGMFEQAHLTVTSAFAVISMLPFHSDPELTLSWQLCLATLDRMISLSTHSRAHSQRKRGDGVTKLCLACPPGHNVSNDIESRVEALADPRCYKACHEPGAQKIIAVGADIEQAGRVLQWMKGLSEVYRNTDFTSEASDDSEEGDAIDEEFTAMKAQSGAMQKPESWLNHDPQALLSLSALLTYDYDPTHSCGLKKPGAAARQKECQAMAIKLSKQVVALHKKKEFDIHQLSMVGMFCVMHNMAIMLKDPSYDYAHKAAIAVRPAIKRYALRWPFAADYVEHITGYIEHEKIVMARHRDPNYYY